MKRCFLTLLILTLGLLSGPRPVLADGISGVLCASDGSRRLVVFDAETGAPKDRFAGFEACENCLVAVGIAPSGVSLPAASRTVRRIQFVRGGVLLAARGVSGGYARGPPPGEI